MSNRYALKLHHELPPTNPSRAKAITYKANGAPTMPARSAANKATTCTAATTRIASQLPARSINRPQIKAAAAPPRFCTTRNRPINASLPAINSRARTTKNAKVAAAVRAEAARSRVSQSRIAATLDLSQAAVSRRMSGVTPFELDELPKVAEILDVPLSHLLKESA